MESNKNALFLGFGVVLAFFFMPLVGFMLLLIFLHWKLKELMWRLQMAILIFMAVFFAGLYLSHGMGGFMGWFLR